MEPLASHLVLGLPLVVSVLQPLISSLLLDSRLEQSLLLPLRQRMQWQEDVACIVQWIMGQRARVHV